MPTPKKSLGQHWLFDQESLQGICDAANIEPTDTVLEIGPGLGPLTVKLTELAKQVVAIELDEQLARELPARVPAPNLQVVQGDVLQFNLSQLPAGYKVVANVPYYVTSLIVRMLLTSPTPPSRAVLLVQKEVAQRLAAKPGDMSVLGVSAQYYAEVTLGSIIEAQKFTPAPKVDSQVVVLQVRESPLFGDIDTKIFFKVVKAGFSEKRKTLRNSLSGGLGLSKEVSEKLLAAAGIAPSARAETLSLPQWHSLTLAFMDVRG
ncbi:MAG TPA: 16S rRNA (adenine(1518)-N(6)/adenine(1519)-N(6))-dimethyltransferase RsmA [Candidatus Saccharimonadales bacterium]|nr:16S rRNA (adenine(1518)-N(6)/adenine(1519)-N(6))-dimethyltransferase RsmA [Candidatus Saccharimonadales bacterium]